MTIIQQKIEQASEIRIVEKLLEGIIGELCWGVRLSFGNELRLEIGPKLPDPVLKGKEKGHWRLGASTSKWILEIPDSNLVDSNDELVLIKEKIKLIEGNYVNEFKIDWPKLGIEIIFSNQMKLKILPIWNKQSELAHWEFFMPNSMFLRMGPKTNWSYYRSDISKKTKM